MKDKELILSEAIKNGKWIDISYKNANNEITYYWIAIKDINLKARQLFVDIFNDQKSLDSKEAIISFDKILSAKTLYFTTYETPIRLIDKIEKNKEDAKWLKYETFNNNILRYYIKCNEVDNDPFQKDTFLIEGIDRQVLLKQKNILLNDIQEKQIIDYIKNYDTKKNTGEVNYLILSFLSIDENDKKYIVLYYDIIFNPSTKRIYINDIPRINQSFLIENKKHSLSSYIDIDPNEFSYNITHDLDDYLGEYTELIRENLRYNEIINQMPEFMILQRNIPVNLEETYNVIEKKYNNGNMDYPLKAFFGNSNRFGVKRKEPSIIIYDEKVNIDQMRVIYNAMKYPITYVQGPPGTGKTQTILNVILSNFFNSKTTLVCSSNNKPIDGILEKLSFKYKDMKIPFPFIRLGNKDEVNKTTNRILDLFNMDTNIYINEDEINSIKNNTKSNNKELISNLEIYEKSLELKQRMECAKKLISNITNINNRVYKSVSEELKKISIEFVETPKIVNSQVLKFVNSVSNDDKFTEYLYLESIKYIKKLKAPKYKELIDICKIKDDEARVISFNKWCSIDENIRLLENAFPIIITTNISSARLGSAYHTFDLVIMDEAGQCNPATALLPIARAKQLLLVGDTNQLKPVIVLENIINDLLKKQFKISEDYDYCKNSILDIMKRHDKISKDIMLTYHYRCGKKIIDFSNKRFYNDELNLEHLTDDGNLSLIDVKNVNSKIRNQNYEEAKSIIEYLKRNKLEDVAIITPFKNQQNLIDSLLKEEKIDNVACGTIHQVQGAEKNTIIISTSVSPKTSKKTYEWLKNNAEITNVAVTRAKNNLVVVADTEAIEKLSTDKKDDLYNLVNYVKSNGKTKILPNESYSIQIGNSNGSKNEDLFFKTITHFCSVNNNIQVKRNVKLRNLFPNDTVLSKSELEFDIVLYKIVGFSFIPQIAIELQGGEHYGNIEREKSDTRKSKICKEKGIILLEIPNSYAKSYETIKQLILICCNQKEEQIELF